MEVDVVDYFSIWHWMIVGAIVLLLFGRGKVSDVLGDVAQGIKAFKKGIAEDEAPKEHKSVVEDGGQHQLEEAAAKNVSQERAEIKQS